MFLVITIQMFEVKAVEDPINIAYSTVGLEPHMDLEYYESPPGLQLLLCARYCLKRRHVAQYSLNHIILSNFV